MIGRYVVDFVILKDKLIIEIDGPVHALFGSNDAERDAWLKAEGFRILRLPHTLAFSPDELMAAVRAALPPIERRGKD